MRPVTPGGEYLDPDAAAEVHRGRQEPGPLGRPVANFGDWQLATYLAGLQGVRPELPMSWADLERRAERALSPELWAYVAGGAGDERTQRVNVEAFDCWGLMPRMLVGAAERDLSVQLFGRRAADAAADGAGRRDRAV